MRCVDIRADLDAVELVRFREADNLVDRLFAEGHGDNSGLEHVISPFDIYVVRHG